MKEPLIKSHLHALHLDQRSLNAGGVPQLADSPAPENEADKGGEHVAGAVRPADGRECIQDHLLHGQHYSDDKKRSRLAWERQGDTAAKHGGVKQDKCTPAAGEG